MTDSQQAGGWELLRRAEQAEKREQRLRECLAWIADNTTEAHIHHSAAAILVEREKAKS